MHRDTKFASKISVVVVVDTINIAGVCPEHYRRDEIGNLTSDVAEDIDAIEWYVHPCGTTAVEFLPEAGFHGVNGKIRAINLSISLTQSQPNLVFAYGPDGQCIRKAVTWRTGGDTTWYVRDAQGKVYPVTSTGACRYTRSAMTVFLAYSLQGAINHSLLCSRCI